VYKGKETEVREKLVTWCTEECPFLLVEEKRNRGRMQRRLVKTESVGLRGVRRKTTSFGEKQENGREGGITPEGGARIKCSREAEDSSKNCEVAVCTIRKKKGT